MINYRILAIMFFGFGLLDAIVVVISHLSAGADRMGYDGAITLFLASCAAGILAKGEGRRP